MRVVAGFFVAAALLAMPFQSSAQEMTDEEVAKVEAEVLSMGDQWLAAVNDVDPDVFLDLFDPAGTHATDGYHYANYKDWVGRVHRLFSSWEDVNWAWVDTRAEVFSSDAAMFVGYAEGTRTNTDGEISEGGPSVTLLMKNSEGAWKLIYQGTAGRWTPPEG